MKSVFWLAMAASFLSAPAFASAARASAAEIATFSINEEDIAFPVLLFAICSFLIAGAIVIIAMFKKRKSDINIQCYSPIANAEITRRPRSWLKRTGRDSGRVQ